MKKAYRMTLDSAHPDLLEIASDAGITDAVFIVEVNNWGNGREIYLAVEDKYSDYIKKSEDINFVTNQFLTSCDVYITQLL